MNRYIISILLLVFFATADAQTHYKPKAFTNQEKIKIDLGAFITTKTTYSKGTYNSSVNNLYHLGLGYTKTIRQYSISLGTRFDYFSEILMNDNNAMMASLYLQNQVNFEPKENTFFFYANAGLAPKLGGDFYGGNIIELGLGWQLKPSWIDKKIHASLGYNATNLKNVYAEFHSSSDGITFITRGAYQRLKLSSLALNIGISF